MSRPLDDIVAEVELLARRGVTEVTLLGQNVNSYGRDITRRRPLFADLLRAVGAVEGIARIRFTSPHPKDLRPETIEAMAHPGGLRAAAPAAPVGQRPGALGHATGLYGGAFLERFAAARSAVDDLGVTTDIIVGFPGRDRP